MTNDIIKIALKHKIYEFCINVCFDSIRRNFPLFKSRVPNVGEKFVKIYDRENDTAYYNCRVVDIKKLKYHEDILEEEDRPILLAIKYARTEYQGELIRENDEEYFTEEEFRYLVFTK